MIVFLQLAELLESQPQEKRFNKIKISVGEGRAENTEGWAECRDESDGKRETLVLPNFYI